MILTGASAVVTGGAVRIGREIGRHLARAGVNIGVHYLSSHQQAEEAVAEFQSFGVQAVAISSDLSQPVQSATEIFERAHHSLGQISILINSAAIFESGLLKVTDETKWDRHVDINLKAPFFLSKRFAQQLGTDQGSIVNLVDWRGESPVPGHDAYTISKAGLIAQTKLLAQELGPSIRVNGIAPGAILPASGESENQFQAKSSLNPLQKTGSPEMIAQAVMYLLESEFVTGEILHITGGQQLSVSN